MLNEPLFLIGSVILICIVLNRFIQRLSIPSLLIFIALGMCFGENGILKIPFDNFALADAVCSASLILIMFYGGFGTNVQAAKPVLVRAVLLSSLGVVLTAAITGLGAHYLLGLPWLESLLIGAVLSSTDAASVFNILRSKNLALRHHTAPLLEIESGSNDPMSYMLTVTILSLMAGQSLCVPLVLGQQIAVGLACGVALGKGAALVLGRLSWLAEHERTVFIFAVAIVAYALPALLGGNGYLSVYLCGILLGSAPFSQKRYLVHFFDALTNVAQVVIFFLLGLLVTPAQLPAVFLPALAIAAVLTFLSRPVSVALLLGPFRPSLPQMTVVSWAGLRGAASIVFAILAVLSDVPLRYNLFNLVFCVVLLSISLQGTLLPWVSRRLGMIDEHGDVAKTFNDYQEESDICFLRASITPGHPWAGRKLKELAIPQDFLVTMIRRGAESIVPNGETAILPGDTLVIAAREFEGQEELEIQETVLSAGHRWNGKLLRQLDLPEGKLMILILRGGAAIIPTGDTELAAGDVVVTAQAKKKL